MPSSNDCPPCSHYTSFLCDTSCKNRPCSQEDDLILEQWEKDDYESFIQWSFDELNYLNRDKLKKSLIFEVSTSILQQRNALCVG
jgi:hypothetical protein